MVVPQADAWRCAHGDHLDGRRGGFEAVVQTADGEWVCQVG
jgi:hypothetical protein